MMGWFLLIVALFAGLGKGLCGKYISNDVKGLGECFVINLMRFAFCALIGFLLLKTQNDVSFNMEKSALIIYCFSAVGITLFSVCWMFAYKSETYVYLCVFTMIGSIVSCLLGSFIYSEHIGIKQFLGMAMILGSIYVLSMYNADISGKIKPKEAIVLSLGTIGSSITDLTQKIYMRESGKNALLFNSYSYAFAFFILFVLFIIYSFKHIERKQCRITLGKRDTLLLIVLSSCLYLNSVTKTAANNYLTMTQIYPTLYGASFILSAFTASLLFKEKMTLKSVVGISGAFLGLIVMNVL